MRDAAKDLVGEGYVAIPVNYRYATQAGWPAQREDLQTALRWVRNNAAKLHVDTNKIVVDGSSAGAEITASALTQGDGSKLARGMALLSGPLDLALVASDTSNSSAVTLGKRVTDDLLRCLPTNCKSELRERSAAYRHDSRDPASLVVFSKGDWVDPRSSYRFHEAALHDGVRSELKAMSGSKHGMKAWDQAWPTIKSWIARRMVPKH
jgi:acetyl esterase/lipase